MYTLLIADDERLERTALRLIIQRGTERIEKIIEAANGREAIAAVTAHKPDIVLLDIKMPGLNGVEAAKRIRELHPLCKIVFLTAFDTFDYAREALRIGAEDFLIKPVEDDRVLELIETLTQQLHRELSERRESEQARDTLQELENYVGLVMSRQMKYGYIDPGYFKEYTTIKKLDHPRLRLARLAIDLQSYPMRIDKKRHANVLLGRCEQITRNKLRRTGWEIVTASRESKGTSAEGEITLLLCCSTPGEVPPLPPLEETLARELSLSCVLQAGPLVEDIEALQQVFVGINPSPDPDRAILHSTTKLEERLCSLLFAWDETKMELLTNDIIRWVHEQETPARATQELTELFVVLRHEISRRVPGIRLPAVRGAFETATTRNEWETTIRVSLKNLHAALAANSARQGHPAVLYVKELLTRRFKEVITVEEIAGLAGQSPSHLSRLFRQQTGLSIIDYLTRIRMRAAEELLVHRKISIGTIAAEVGYRDANYFSRVFRRETGMTPREYRMAHSKHD